MPHGPHRPMLLAPTSCRAAPPSRPCLSPAAAPTRRRRVTVSASASRIRREEVVARMPPLAHREVVLALAAEAEARLLPSEVPTDVAWFRSAAGDAVSSVDVCHGAPGSSIAFMLEAWFHRKLPGGGGAIDITALVVNLNGATDAPHLLMEFIQGGPASLIVLLDLLPRVDLPLHPSYMEKYYAATGLDGRRRFIGQVLQARPYVSPLLFIRSMFSPMAVVADVQCGEGGAAALDGIVRGQLAGTAMDVLGVWLEHCSGGGTPGTEMEATERERMVARDRKVGVTELELNLAANLPRMFDAGVADRVVAEIRKAFMGG